MCPPNHKGLGDAGPQEQPSSYAPTLPMHSLVLGPEPSAWVNLLIQLMFAEHLCGSRLAAIDLGWAGTGSQSRGDGVSAQSCPNRWPQVGTSSTEISFLPVLEAGV